MYGLGDKPIHDGSCKAAFWGSRARINGEQQVPTSPADSAAVSSASVHRWSQTAAAWRTFKWGANRVLRRGLVLVNG